MNYSQIKEAIKNNKTIFKIYDQSLEVMYRISPKLAVMYEYFVTFGYSLDLKNPKTMNEKINYLKFNEDPSLKTICCDKYRVREYIEKKGYGDILNELYGVWDRVDDIEWDKLPERYIIKCNHGCGYNIIVDENNPLNKEDAIKKLNKWMNTKYGVLHYENQYLPVKHKIICEKLLTNADGSIIDNYDFYCGKGKVGIIRKYVDIKGVDHQEMHYYDRDKKFVLANYPSSDAIPELSANIDRMIEIAENISNDFSFVRVDLYDVEGKIILGELSFTPTGGFCTLFPKEWDEYIGSLVPVPTK